MTSPETIHIEVRGERCPALFFPPTGRGPHPGVAIGQEATGPNEFIRGVGATLAAAGYAVVVPDYYRGEGPPDPEAYDDIETLLPFIDRLDFRRATYDLMGALDFLAARPDVDADRLAVWGYCTGATLALLAASLRPGLRATVLFYPSQPRFEVHDRTRPIDPLDLLWNITSPVLLIIGDRDVVWPAELVADVKALLEQWGIDHTINEYAGAGHAFCAPAPGFHHPEACAAASRDAFAFLQRAT
jgi:carboxymethylenebutenolidase